MTTNSGAAITILILNLILIGGVIFFLIKTNKKTPSKSGKQKNTQLNLSSPQKSDMQTITLINPLRTAGTVSVDGKKSSLLPGDNIITIPSKQNTVSINWSFSGSNDNVVRHDLDLRVFPGAIYVLSLDGVFKQTDWSRKLPIITVPFLRTLTDADNIFESDYIVEPLVSEHSSVKVVSDGIVNVFRGLPIRVTFENKFTGEKNSVTLSISHPKQPLYLLENVEWIGDKTRVVTIATQDVVIISSSVTAKLFIQLSKNPGTAGRIYRLFSGNNYFDASSENNRWLRLVSESGRDIGGWMPIDNYATNGYSLQ